MLSFVCLFSMSRSNFFSSLAVTSVDQRRITSVMWSRVYQMSMSRIAANSAIASR